MKNKACDLVNCYVKAVFPFEESHTGELSLCKNDIIHVVEAVDDNWLKGTIRGYSGTFPCSYVEKLSLPAVHGETKVFGALEDFRAQQNGDLDFEKGDVIIGIRQIDQNWWEGTCRGHQGIFPLALVLELQVPSSLRSRSQSVHSQEPMYGIARCDIQGQLDEELSFKTGDMITITDIIDDDWFLGELAGKKGMLLASCVDLVQDIHVVAENDMKVDKISQSNNEFIRSKSDSHTKLDDKHHPIENNSVKTSCNDRSENGSKVCHFENTISVTDISSGATADFKDSLPVKNHYTARPLVSSIVEESVVQENTDNVVLSDVNGMVPYARTLYPFVGQSPDELSFKENEMVFLIQHVDNQWIEGELDGRIGLFPASYVSVIIDCPWASDSPADPSVVQIQDCSADSRSVSSSHDDSALPQITVQKPPDILSTKPTRENSSAESEISYGLVLYSFQAETLDDLSVTEGETVEVVLNVDDNWVIVRNDAGCQGMCPQSFIQVFHESPSGTPNVDSKSLTTSVNECNELASTKELKAEDLSIKSRNNATSKSIDLKSSEKSISFNVPSSDKLQRIKPSVSPKPQLKPKPKLLPKPSIKPKELMPKIGEIPKSSSTTCLPDTYKLKDTLRTGIPTFGSSEEIRTQDSGKSQPSRKGSVDLELLIKDEMARAKNGIERKGSARSTTTTEGAGDDQLQVKSPPLVKGQSEDRGQLGKLQRPPPPSRAALSNRHSVNFPVSFDEENHFQSTSSQQSPLTRSSAAEVVKDFDPLSCEATYTTGQSSFFVEPVQPLSISNNSTKNSRRKSSVKRPPPPNFVRKEQNTGTTPLPTTRKRVPSRPAPPTPKEGTTCIVTKRQPPPRPTEMAKLVPPSQEQIEISLNASRRKSQHEANAEIITDLKRRLKEIEEDLQKYKGHYQELESLLQQPDAKEHSSEVHDNMEFYAANIQGLTEELSRLRENLKEVCPAEIEAVAKQVALEKKREEEERFKQEEAKRLAELKVKRREKRQKVIEELIQTEKDYLSGLNKCIDVFFSPEAERHSDFDLDFVFGNMEEISEVSQKLLTSLESATSAKGFEDQIIGECFVALAEDMKNVYAPYCRNHDDVITLMEKLRGNQDVQEYIEQILDKLRASCVVFDLEAILIKPVQRIMKYPLLLNELEKTTDADHADKSGIQAAITAMTDVAAAINEYKRRKDLVFKYKKDSEESLGDKLAKLSLHSLKKKGSRFKGRLSTSIGLAPQTRDETFDREMSRFSQLEKMVRLLYRNVQSFLEHMQDVLRSHESLVAEFQDYVNDVPNKTVKQLQAFQEELQRTISSELEETIENQVTRPLGQLIKYFDGPNKVIQKRYDKLLDYDSMLRKAKDDKTLEKALQVTRQDYEAMNAQLIDELPKMFTLALDIVLDCIGALVGAQQAFSSSVQDQLSNMLDLASLLEAETSIVEAFSFQHVTLLDRLSLLSFIPKGFNPRVDSLKPDRKSKRLSVDGGWSKNPEMLQVSSQGLDNAKTSQLHVNDISQQSDSQRAYLRQKYSEDKLFVCNNLYTANELMDLTLTPGDLVGLLVDKDPMGNRERWFVDNGVGKGLVPKKVLCSFKEANINKDLNSDILTLTETAIDFNSGSVTYNPQPEVQRSDSSRGRGIKKGMTVDDEQLEFALDEDMSPDVTEELDLGNVSEEYFYAAYEFKKRSETEVTLFEGQVVNVLSKHDKEGNKEWWFVDADGIKGYAPAAYLQPMGS